MLKTLEADGKFHSYDSFNHSRSKLDTDGQPLPERTFHCDRCNKDIIHHSKVGTGYGSYDSGKLYCFDCCGDMDRLMLETSDRATLYLVDPDSKNANNGVFKITNWPGTLSFDGRWPIRWRHGKHQTRAVRVEFYDHKGNRWIATRYSDNTQVAHCRKIKKAS